MDNKTAGRDGDGLHGNDGRTQDDRATKEKSVAAQSELYATGSVNKEPDFPSAQPRVNTADDTDETWTKVTYRAQKRRGKNSVGDDVSTKRIA